MIYLRNEHGMVSIDPYGAQVLAYKPTGQADVLWHVGEDGLAAARAEGRPMRGGIPVCWPWFGPHPENKGPQHGYARLGPWRVADNNDDRAVFTLNTMGQDAGFPHRARAELEVLLSEEGLVVSLATTNTGNEPLSLPTQALHTYLRVSEVSKVGIYGLKGVVNDKGRVGGKVEAIVGEVDDVYSPILRPLRVVDPKLGRTIEIENFGGLEAVIWNPGSDKADMPAGSFRNFLCVEAAALEEGTTVLEPGQRHRLSTRLRVV
ncbi:MAG: hypothetical protein GC129_05205 [Proteobacteria bacterium]|nr:hypothetical protein [Pseudomonadota bacterium]